MNEIEQGCDESVNEHFRGGLEMEIGRERWADKWGIGFIVSDISKN